MFSLIKHTFQPSATPAPASVTKPATNPNENTKPAQYALPNVDADQPRDEYIESLNQKLLNLKRKLENAKSGDVEMWLKKEMCEIQGLILQKQSKLDPTKMHAPMQHSPATAIEVDLIDAINKLASHHQTKNIEKWNQALARIAEMTNALNKTINSIEASTKEKDSKTIIDKTKAIEIMGRFLSKWAYDANSKVPTEKEALKAFISELEDKNLGVFNSQQEAINAFKGGFKDLLEVVQVGNKFYICISQNKWLDKIKINKIYQEMKEFEHAFPDWKNSRKTVETYRIDRGTLVKKTDEEIIEIIFKKVEEIVEFSANNQHGTDETRPKDIGWSLAKWKNVLVREVKKKNWNSQTLKEKIIFNVQMAIKYTTTKLYKESGGLFFPGNDAQIPEIQQFMEAHYPDIMQFINGFFAYFDSHKNNQPIEISLESTQLNVLQNIHNDLKASLKPLQSQITANSSAAIEREKNLSQLLSDLLRVLANIANKI